MARKEYTKIVKIGLSYYYGFLDASYIELAYCYRDGTEIKGRKHIYVGAYRHSTVGIEYAKFCGLKHADELWKIEGKKVAIDYELDENGYLIMKISRPEDYLHPYGKPFFEVYVNEDDDENWDEQFVISGSR